MLTGKRSYTLMITSVRESESVDLWEEEREVRVPEGRLDFLEDMVNNIRRRCWDAMASSTSAKGEVTYAVGAVRVDGQGGGG